MTKESYEKIFQKIRSNDYGVLMVWWIGKLVTYVTALCFLVVVAMHFFAAEWIRIGIMTGVPAVSFVAVSLFRSIYNESRPYETYGFEPLILKDTKGKSFPSRHVFSIFVIAGTLFWFYPAVGCVIGIMGMVLAVIRVISGVHFPKDVIGGALIGLFCSGIAGIMLLWI